MVLHVVCMCFLTLDQFHSFVLNQDVSALNINIKIAETWTHLNALIKGNDIFFSRQNETNLIIRSMGVASKLSLIGLS